MKTKTTLLTCILRLASISTATLFTMGLINPVFSAPPPKAAVTVTVDGAGTVTSDPAGIICPTDCTQQYKKKNTVVTFTATNDANYSFSGWEGACTGTDPTCVVQVSEPTSITAHFKPPVQTPAPVPATGQTNCYDATGNQIDCTGTGQDGDVQAGVADPVPRFEDRLNGTVLDKLTRLVWLKDARCSALGSGPPFFPGEATWQYALESVNNLANGQCGLMDGSNVGDWRLPNVKELYSLINHGFLHPALSPEGGVFSNVQWAYYWSSTSFRSASSPLLYFDAWSVDFGAGIVSPNGKAGNHYVWPVRGEK